TRSGHTSSEGAHTTGTGGTPSTFGAGLIGGINRSPTIVTVATYGGAVVGALRGFAAGDGFFEKILLAAFGILLVGFIGFMVGYAVEAARRGRGEKVAVPTLVLAA